MKTEAYIKAKEMLLSVSTEKGFFASKSDISNYKRIWARDGVIFGLALVQANRTKQAEQLLNQINFINKENIY